MRNLRPPPKIKDNPELERWLRDLADALLERDADIDSRIPPTKRDDVNVVSRGDMVETQVSHKLGRVPTGFVVIGTPDTRDDDDLWTIKQSRRSIGSESVAYFKTNAPSGKVFRIRLEAT
jgi:hypothetical protein